MNDVRFFELNAGLHAPLMGLLQCALLAAAIATHTGGVLLGLPLAIVFVPCLLAVFVGYYFRTIIFLAIALLTGALEHLVHGVLDLILNPGFDPGALLLGIAQAAPIVIGVGLLFPNFPRLRLSESWRRSLNEGGGW